MKKTFSRLLLACAIAYGACTLPSHAHGQHDASVTLSALPVASVEPTTITLGPLTRLGGRVSAANVAFDDHPNEKRFSDRIETVTVDSVFAWLQKSGLAGAPVTLKL